MSDKKYKKEDCITLLKEMQAKLQSSGENRYPKRSDFSDDEVVAIKSFLGPWPRALEAAGLKPERDGDRAQKNKEKRIRAKRTRIVTQNEEKKQKILTEE